MKTALHRVRARFQSTCIPVVRCLIFVVLLDPSQYTLLRWQAIKKSKHSRLVPWLSRDDVEPGLCDCPKFVPWHRGPAEYNPTTTNLLLPSHFEGVWGIPPAAGGKQELSNSHYKPLGLSPKKASGFPWSLEAWLGFIFIFGGPLVEGCPLGASNRFIFTVLFLFLAPLNTCMSKVARAEWSS